MKSFMKKTVAALLLAALCLSGLPCQPQTAKAAESIAIIDTSTENPAPSATAGQAYTKKFTLTQEGDLAFGIITVAKCNFTYEITDSSGRDVLAPTNVTSLDNNWDTSGNAPMYVIGISNATKGTFTLSLTFTEDQSQFDIYGVLVPSTATPSLDATNLTITKGFKGKVSVLNAGGAKITYTSSNTAVATVDANGNVTAKKKGTANITVKTSTGYSGVCKVTVKDNVYSKAKTAVSAIPSGSFVVDVYNVSYDSKGNLVIKTRMLNNRGFKAKYLKNLKITVKNKSGKTIGVYSAKKKTINLASGKAKAYTFTVKKSKLKIKSKQDLRIADRPSVSGKYYYSR